MRTRAEVRAFLDTLVGTIVVNKPDPDYNGQCVTLIKAILEFLGVPNPYAARGDAIIVGDTLLRQGIASAGKGWLTVVVNRDMGYIDGVHYGHVWADLKDEANYESNGRRALYTTKNTRPISQGQQFINLDKWIKEGDMKFTKEQEMTAAQMATGYNPGDNYNYPFTVEEVTQASLDKFLQTWRGRVTTVTKEQEQIAAEAITGVKGIIGKDYNSKFVGQPVVSHYPQMVQFWLNYKNNMPTPPAPGKPVLLDKGVYEVK